jgi:hypothetical protein
VRCRKVPGTPPRNLFGAGQQIPLTFPVLEAGPTLHPTAGAHREAGSPTVHRRDSWLLSGVLARDRRDRAGAMPPRSGAVVAEEVVVAEDVVDEPHFLLDSVDDPPVQDLGSLLGDPPDHDVVWTASVWSGKWNEMDDAGGHKR